MSFSSSDKHTCIHTCVQKAGTHDLIKIRVYIYKTHGSALYSVTGMRIFSEEANPEQNWATSECIANALLHPTWSCFYTFSHSTPSCHPVRTLAGGNWEGEGENPQARNDHNHYRLPPVQLIMNTTHAVHRSVCRCVIFCRLVDRSRTDNRGGWGEVEGLVIYKLELYSNDPQKNEKV